MSAKIIATIMKSMDLRYGKQILMMSGFMYGFVTSIGSYDELLSNPITISFFSSFWGIFYATLIVFVSIIMPEWFLFVFAVILVLATVNYVGCDNLKRLYCNKN